MIAKKIIGFIGITRLDKPIGIYLLLWPALIALFISSEASVEKSKSFKIKINSSKNPKCTRCWHRHASVGTSKEHPELCYRCIENIDDNGEQRSFV